MSTTNILNNLFNNMQLRENLDIKSSKQSDNVVPPLSFINRQTKTIPIDAKESARKTFDYGDHLAINKSYDFLSHEHFMYFVNEVLNNAKRLDHDINLVINGSEVEINLFTKDINDVTDIDLKLSRIIDEIFQDIYYID